MPFLADTSPYPWPYDGCLDPARLALLVAGAQVGWRDASTGALDVAARIAETVAAVRHAGGVVVILLHDRGLGRRRPGPFPPVAGTAAAEPSLARQAGDVVLHCTGIDGFAGSPLDGELRARGVDHLALCGFGAEASVDSTLRSANDRGYECLTLTDAVAPFDVDLGRHALASVTMSGGIFGAIGPSTALVAALAPALSLCTVSLEAP